MTSAEYEARIKELGDMIHERGNTIAALRRDLKKVEAENERLRAELADGSFYKESDIDRMQAEIERLRAEVAHAALKGETP